MSAEEDRLAQAERDDEIGEEIATREVCGAPIDDEGHPVPCPNRLPCLDHPWQGARRPERREVSCAMRVTARNEGHTTVTVWVGRNEGARGNAGKLVFRTDEWNELVEAPYAIDSAGRLRLAFEVLPSPL